MEKEKRLIKHTFKTTEAEAETIRRKMEALGIRNESAYMRAMALNGYILKLDLPQIREMLRLLRNMTNNLNQISKRLNAHGQMYETEIEEVQQKQDDLWVMMRQLLSLTSNTGSAHQHPGRCTGDCAHCPAHYGYRYGRWYYGHHHTHGCEFGGNDGSGKP